MRNSYDGEIGRGRRTGNDSSSSRESSLGRSVPKRPFSPVGSDAGEPSLSVDSPPVTHSPPQARPLIRDPVAFASDKPQNIITYEATPPPSVTVQFLPGQEVPVAPKKKAKRTKKGDIFSAQTSKFRIDTYDPTPSTQPPIAHGNGPYSSMYRGTPAPPKPPRKVSPATTATSSTYARNSSTASSNPPSSYAPPYGVSSVPTRSQAPLQQAPPVMMSQSPPNKRAEMPSHFTDMEGRPPHEVHYYSNYPPPPASNSSASAYTPSPYYRHDYERGTWGPGHSRSPRQKSRNHRSMDHSQDSDSSVRYHTRDSGRADPQSSSSAPQRSKNPLRMLTLLIKDVRSGTEDHQLAEVKVPLRLADDAGTGFWADARDIMEQLQRGPSRIDGPAKMYTPRGKYRQFILRVSKDNDDEFISANVAVAGDRTVDLVVELPNPPGVPPAPPKIPSGLLDSPPYDDYEQELSSDQMDVIMKTKPDQTQDARKRANSASFDDYDGPDSPPPPKVGRHNYSSESARHHPQRHQSPESTIGSGPSPGAREGISKERRYHDPIPATPPIPSSPRPYEADFMRILKEKVRQYDGKGFADFFRSNVGNTLSDTLSQYRFLSKILKQFIGQKMEAYALPVEEKHIVRLMKIQDYTFVEDCKETMRLMPLYGDPTFPRYDPKITAMLGQQISQSKEHARKEFLHLLYRNDNIWNNRPPDGPRPLGNKSQTSSSDSSLSSRGDSGTGTRATKAMFVE